MTTTQHETRGARGVETTGAQPIRSSAAAVVEHDLDHIRDEAARVQVKLWADRQEDSPSINAASALEQTAERLSRAVMSGYFTDPQLVALKEVPRLLGKALADIDPERAR